MFIVTMTVANTVEVNSKEYLNQFVQIVESLKIINLYIYSKTFPFLVGNVFYYRGEKCICQIKASYMT